ncbi:MAG TPA: hypothetical protein VK453_06255 [Micromonosporaceae bacterium]|nr:hypothetical protein [Micromonosporaceae bacterium]
MSTHDLTRELLVRYLDTWTPMALHRARRATFVQAWAASADAPAAEAALRVFGEFADRMRGRRLAMVVVATDAVALSGRLQAVQVALGTPPDLAVHPVPGPGAALLPAALAAAGAAGAPLLVYLDTVDGRADETADDTANRTGHRTPFDAVAVGRPAELLLLSADRDWPEHRRALHAAGFELTAGVHLVGEDGTERLLAFATGSMKSLEAFKNALWAVDEYAGVRYRDPSDPEGHLLDVSLSPHPGPLRRELLSHLGAAGGCSVTDLRRFTLTETVYRASDTLGALSALLAAGTVMRRPERGRLAGDVVITATGSAGSRSRDTTT